MQGSTLIGNQVVQVRQAGEKRWLTPTWMMEALHHKQFPVDGVMGLIQYCAHRWHLRVGEHRIATRFLGLKPAPHALAMVRANGRGDVVGKTASALAQRRLVAVLGGSEARKARLGLEAVRQGPPARVPRRLAQ